MKNIIRLYANRALILLGSALALMITFSGSSKPAMAQDVGGCDEYAPCLQGGYGAPSTCWFGNKGYGDQCFCGSDSGNWACSLIGPPGC